MKRFFGALLSIICLCLCFSFNGCNNNDGINFYIPDGAPALSVAELLYENQQFDSKINYNVVSSNEISTYILKETADIAILPTNIASKLCGSGEKYQAIGICTFGNLYIIGNKNITDLSELKGETIGCIQVQNVPGLTLKYIFSNNNIQYTTDETQHNEENVLIKGIEGTDVVAQFKANKINFAVVAEPLCSTAISKFENNEVFELFDLQKLYGKDNYPQSLMIAKTDIIQNNKQLILKIIQKMKNNITWTSENVDKCVNAISDHLTNRTTPSFNKDNFDINVLKNCNIGFKLAIENSESILNYINNLSAIENSAVGNIDKRFWFVYE